jgi:hypothetical protein
VSAPKSASTSSAPHSSSSSRTALPPVSAPVALPSATASFDGVDFAAFSLPKSSGFLPPASAEDGAQQLPEGVGLYDDDEDVRVYFDGGPDEADYTTAASILHETSSSSLPSTASSQLRVPATAQHWASQRWLIGTAFFLLGFAPFTLINTLWSQTSIFRSCLPEGNGIATLIGGAYNAATILPLLYMFVVTRFRLSDRAVSVVGSLFGVAVAVVLAIFWKDTVPIGGAESSIVVIAMTFAAGIVGALLGIVVFSYAAEFPPFATTLLSLGMGVNGVLVTGLGFAQKAGASSTGEPLFSPSTAFYGAAVQLGVAVASMAIIEWRICMSFTARATGGAYQRLPTSAAADSNNNNNNNSNNLEDTDDDAKRAFRANVNADRTEVGSDNLGAAKAGTESRELVASAELPRSPAPPHSIWLVLWAASYPCVTQFAKAVMVYFISPGLLPFLTPKDTLVNALFFTASASNLFGRLLTGWVHFRHLWLVNVFCFACLLYELAVAMWPTLTDKDVAFPLPTWVLVPVTGVSALANGYVSTEVFLAGDRRVVEVLGDGEHIKRVRRWVSIANQVGSLVGTYLCVLVVHVHLLGPFRNDRSDSPVALCFSD